MAEYGNMINLEVMGSLKAPPAWSPDQDNQYPFRCWLTDVTMWAAAAAREVLPDQQGSAVALRLGGAARSLAREIPDVQLRGGAIVDPGDGGGARQLTGLQLLLLILSQSFAPLGDESELRATNYLLGFYRKNSEDIDQTLSRFEVVRRRVATLVNFNMGP